MVARPVEVSPVQNAFPIVDPATGRATKTFQFFLLKMWERTGGFDDEFFELLTVSNLGQIQGLIAGAQLEAFERKLGDAAALARLSTLERVNSEVEELKNRLSFFLSLMAARTTTPPQPGLVSTFESDGDYNVNYDSPTITVFCIGGGGGGGGGAFNTVNPVGGGSGGGGGGFSFATYRTETLPATITVTVGLGGSGGVAGANGSDGGVSTFGDFLCALGGNNGLAGTTTPVNGGAATTAYGNLYQGGPGADSDTTGGDSASNLYAGAPGGGAGGNYLGSTGGDGGAGSWRSQVATGGGGAGGTTGIAGQTATDFNMYIAPGFGGGGGGGSASGDGGAGGDGVRGGGGGGGGACSLVSFEAGAGGRGGDGIVFVVENL